MLPPVLEIYVIWHPGDVAGAQAAEQISSHFHGTSFSGLIGGAIEVYVRSGGWKDADDAPRPLPFMETLPHGVAAPECVAVVPVLGRELAFELERKPDGVWQTYLSAIVAAHRDTPDRVRAFPLAVDEGVLSGTRLGGLLGAIQEIGIPSQFVNEAPAERRGRDLAQALAQFITGSPEQLRVFVSHTKRAGGADGSRLRSLIERTRYLISNTRLDEFFDANTLQAGTDWAEELVQAAGRGALLAVRTDLYASRRWCQSEMLTAKQEGVPVVILDALDRGEERGSFLMDHVPRIPGGAEPEDGAIMRALNQLVDECLKRALWERQKRLAADRPDLAVAWWAPHAPEPATLLEWLRTHAIPEHPAPFRILHPDPPLGPDELETLTAIAVLAGAEGRLEIMTPRGLAARGA